MTDEPLDQSAVTAPAPAETGPTIQPQAPPTPKRTVPIWVAVAALIVGAGGGFLLGNSGGDDPSSTKPPLSVDDLKLAMQRCDDSETGASAINSLDCGLTVTVFDDGGLEIAYYPILDSSGNGDKAIDDIGAATDCWTSTDRSKMGQTRALDGRVESTSGRSSWTYHPDDGLSIICNPAP